MISEIDKALVSASDAETNTETAIGVHTAYIAYYTFLAFGRLGSPAGTEFGRSSACRNRKPYLGLPHNFGARKIQANKCSLKMVKYKDENQNCCKHDPFRDPLPP